MLQGVSERLERCSKYGKQRRYRKRHRKRRFDNRKRANGWLAPSIQHKLDPRYRLSNMVKQTLPATIIVVAEKASFHIQRIKSPTHRQYQ